MNYWLVKFLKVQTGWRDKSVLSLNRLEKILWIKQTLLDKDAILKKGWDTKNKVYFKDRRVAIVKENYVVIIQFTGLLRAKFITAYEKDNVENILKSPDIERSEKYFGEITAKMKQNPIFRYGVTERSIRTIAVRNKLHPSIIVRASFR